MVPSIINQNAKKHAVPLPYTVIVYTVIVYTVILNVVMPRVIIGNVIAPFSVNKRR